MMFVKTSFLARDKAAAKVQLAKLELPRTIRNFLEHQIEGLTPSDNLGEGVAEVIKVAFRVQNVSPNAASRECAFADVYVGWRLLF